jgi:hypothetical protein
MLQPTRFENCFHGGMSARVEKPLATGSLVSTSK